MQSLQKVQPSSTWCSRCKSKRCETNCKEGMLQVETCPTMPFQHKLHRTLQHVTLTLELGSTFCNDCRDSLKPLQVATQDCNAFLFCWKRCNVSHNTISTQAAQNITACNTNFRARLYFLQRLERLFETIANWNPRLQRVFVLLETLQRVSKCHFSTSCTEHYSV